MSPDMLQKMLDLPVPTGSTSAGDDASIEAGFQAWLKKHKIKDADAPDRNWNYRGAYLAGVDPDKHGELPDVFRLNVMDTWMDPATGLYRPWGSSSTDPPDPNVGDPAYSNPGNLLEMSLGMIPGSPIQRPLNSIPGEGIEERRARETREFMQKFKLKGAP